MALHDEKDYNGYGAVEASESGSIADEAFAELAKKKPQVAARQPHSLLGIFYILLGKHLHF